MLHVMDAVLQGGKAGGYGITSEAPVYLRNVTSAGSAYAATAIDAYVNPRVTLTGQVWEYVSGPVVSTYPSPARSLGLEIKDVPSVPWDAPAQWASASGGFQAAVNSGKSTIYFPANGAATGGEVHINTSTVKRIVGLGRQYPGKVVFDNTDPNSVVVVQKLRFGGGVEVKSAGKVVLKSFMGAVTISGTNPNGSQAAVPREVVGHVEAGARMQGSVLIASTPTGSAHAVRVVDMKGRRGSVVDSVTSAKMGGNWLMPMFVANKGCATAIRIAQSSASPARTLPSPRKVSTIALSGRITLPANARGLAFFNVRGEMVWEYSRQSTGSGEVEVPRHVSTAGVAVVKYRE